MLRHQINVLKPRARAKPQLMNVDRLIFVWLYRLIPRTLVALAIVKPATVIRWRRIGVRCYWHWKSRYCGGRPKTAPEIRPLIQEMSHTSPLWGAPRILGELLKLGIDIEQTTVAKYMPRH